MSRSHRIQIVIRSIVCMTLLGIGMGLHAQQSKTWDAVPITAWLAGNDRNYARFTTAAAAIELQLRLVEQWRSAYYCRNYSVTVSDIRQVKPGDINFGPVLTGYYYGDYRYDCDGVVTTQRATVAYPIAPICKNGTLRFDIDKGTYVCAAAIVPKTLGSTCQGSTPHPITYATGNKWLSETDVSGNGGLGLIRTYSSNPVTIESIWGGNWASSYAQILGIETTSGRVLAQRSQGNAFIYAPTSGGNTYLGDPDVNAVLIRSVDASGTPTSHTITADNQVEQYDSVGRLVSITPVNGPTQTISYDANGRLSTVSIPSGHQLVFGYDAANRVVNVTDTAGRIVTYAYSFDKNLTRVTYPDGKTKTYHYNEPANTSGFSFPNALTGITDENNVRYVNYSYDSTGRAKAESLSGGVDNYQLTFGTNQTVVTDPLGAVFTYNFQTILGVPKSLGRSQPGGSGCGASTSGMAYDASGNLISKDDFSGNRTCYAYDTKNQEITRVEGLATSVDCATVLPANSALPANARKTTTSYHPDWRMPNVVTAPGSITTSIYHGQPDPFNSNAVANCTPAANLPNGKPRPLLCKQVVQATLSSGALDSTVANTVTRYTYNAAGKVLTATDSLNRTTTYTYYPTTAFTGTDPNAVGNTAGDLMTITNPAGFFTTFNSYDKTGRILKMTDPKGIVTDMTYTPRGWVNTVTTTAPGQSARTTSYTYDGVGQLTGVSNPDGSTLAYTYDAAHRLIGATDAKGNSVTYTLDNMGNRIKEDIKDPTGVLQRSIDRSFDALNRLQQVSGAVQ